MDPRLLRTDQQESRADLCMEILKKWGENPEYFSYSNCDWGQNLAIEVQSRGQNSIEAVAVEGRKWAGQSKKSCNIQEGRVWPLSSGMQRGYW
jgi:hypothetical protein